MMLNFNLGFPVVPKPTPPTCESSAVYASQGEWRLWCWAAALEMVTSGLVPACISVGTKLNSAEPLACCGCLPQDCPGCDVAISYDDFKALLTHHLGGLVVPISAKAIANKLCGGQQVVALLELTKTGGMHAIVIKSTGEGTITVYDPRPSVGEVTVAAETFESGAKYVLAGPLRQVLSN